MINFKKVTFTTFLSLCILFFVVAPIFTKNIDWKLIDRNGYLKQLITPTPFNPFPYTTPKIPYSRAYITMLIGDSIVESLGPNANLLREHLIEYYPAHEFVNYNFGLGATNIETLPDRLAIETEYKGRKVPSVLSQGFDLIIIESFAYNPLSHEYKSAGVEKHIQILDESVRRIIKEKPNTIVALMTPIAPNKKMFAKGVYDLSDEERTSWVEERLQYIYAVSDYAKRNGIPLIDVYEKSVNNDGDGELKYINPDDFIHPSHEGIDLMSRTIADFIFTNKIFPQ